MKGSEDIFYMESVLRIPRIWIHTKKILNQNAGVSIILKGSYSIPFFIFDASCQLMHDASYHIYW
jgi:hypothetical protein